MENMENTVKEGAKAPVTDEQLLQVVLNDLKERQANYVVLIGNEGNHEGIARKWVENDYFYDLKDACERLDHWKRELEDTLQPVTLVDCSLLAWHTGDSDHPFYHFKGGGRGYLPGCLRGHLEEAKTQANLFRKEMKRDAERLGSKRLKRKAKILKKFLKTYDPNE